MMHKLSRDRPTSVKPKCCVTNRRIGASRYELELEVPDGAGVLDPDEPLELVLELERESVR